MYPVEMGTEHPKLAGNSGIVARLFRHSRGAFLLPCTIVVPAVMAMESIRPAF